VRNLIMLATPVDYSQMGAMVAAVLEGRLDPDELLDHTGNVPADALYTGFRMQAPTRQIALYATLLENLWSDEFVEGYQAMATWSRDHVPFPGATMRQIVEDFVRRNVLMTGKVRLGDRVVDLTKMRANVLNAFAENDIVVPVGAAEPASGLIGDPARRDELRLGGGHVTFATGRQAFKHTLPALTRWIAEHSDELDPPKER
jgi:polyhydroxyalkanoate synthase